MEENPTVAFFVGLVEGSPDLRKLAATCSDCGAVLTRRNAFHPYGDCPATRCKDCEAAAWGRIDAIAATHPANPAYSNGWD